MLKNHYISLTKPGIIFGNLITTVGGFYLAKPHADFSLLLFTLWGISLVIASGCVFNNFFDRDIDQLMERTRQRASAQGLVSGKSLIYFAILLGISGFSVLFFLTNTLTTLIAAIGLFFYVAAYTLMFKRRSVYGTVIGSISGAVPPVVGYCASSGLFDLGALLLFVMLVLWQMPHSYAIAIYRLKDYASASIPVLPVIKGIEYTKKIMCIYVGLFAIASMSLTFFSYTGMYYLTLTIILNMYWLYLSIQGFKTQDNAKWAKRIFLFSIIEITALSAAMAIN